MGYGRKVCLLFLLLRIIWLRVDGESQVPCYFISGDSLVDSGNNNNLATMAKADYLPYGIDFPRGPTGRFCNGRTTANIIGELLGFENFIPSFSMSINDSQLANGVNYGSGSAGILQETGKATIVRNEWNRTHRMHSIALHGTNGSLCVDSMNEAVNLFNFKIQFLVNQLNTDLTHATLLYLDAYGFLSQYIASPAGLEVQMAACCEVNKSGRCIPYEAPCKLRNLFLLWESFHPTEVANIIGGGLSYLALRHIL